MESLNHLSNNDTPTDQYYLPAAYLPEMCTMRFHVPLPLKLLLLCIDFLLQLKTVAKCLWQSGVSNTVLNGALKYIIAVLAIWYCLQPTLSLVVPHSCWASLQIVVQGFAVLRKALHSKRVTFDFFWINSWEEGFLVNFQWIKGYHAYFFEYCFKPDFFILIKDNHNSKASFPQLDQSHFSNNVGHYLLATSS